ncbi:hypothetical protein [Chthonobacter albigriseus]|uniref:hypothetical protein n=1 Tax=Chthonobacter albigriseus TaxID=1683161 RepID=UPI0015EE6173|nr:hypothetical protein [Chthonobacter albigriseus]
MLRDPDANTRITAMSAMISSGNPVLVRRARQAGLTSSDPDMRATALKAVFDAGGPFRVVLDLSKADEKTTRVREWLSGVGETASADGQSASFLLSADAYDPDAKCWKAPNSSYCAIVLAGETITLPTLRRAVASLTLGDDGVFRGTLATQLGSNAMPPVPASIDILE